MKREIGYKVLIKLLIVVIVIILSFVTLNYNRINQSLFNQYTTTATSEAKVQESYVRVQLEKLQTDTSYLGKDILYNTERDIYLLQDFIKSQKSVSDIYLFDDDYNFLGEAGKEHQYRQLVKEEIKDKFFYDFFIWSHLENETYFLYYKVPNETSYYLGMVIDLNQLFDQISTNTTTDICIINGFGKSVSQSQMSRQSDINQLSFRNQLLEGHRLTLFDAKSFYSFLPVDFSGVDLFVLYKNSQQSYLNERRQFIIRNVLLSLFVVTFTLLQGWQLIKRLYALFVHSVVDRNYNVDEFSKIKKELDKAIHWVNDVVKHYDELNELKEELIVLSHSIPEEGENNVKNKNKKN